MPHQPEDDWTRPIPRSDRGRRARPRRPAQEDWWAEEEDRYGAPAGDQDPDATVRIPVAPARPGVRGESNRTHAPAPARSWQDADDRYDDRRYDDGARPPGGGRPPPGPPARRRPRYGIRRLLLALLLVVLLWVGALLSAALASWNSIERVDATPEQSERPAATAGSNFLLVGTDSRAELTREERNDLVTGHDTEGTRADTIMVLHLSSSGDPTLVSVPRDSYVEIPGSGWNKINAAYAQGGPELLVAAVESATGLPIDGYLEIGFGGFVEVVGTVGGVRMCLEEPVQDERTRLDLPAGCQELEGSQALNYVRARYSDPRGDLGRVERQREFLGALVQEMASPGILLLPWRLHDVGTATGSALALGEDTSMWEAGRMALAMRTISGGGGQSVTVPVADANYVTGAGSTVLWDEQPATALFEALRNDESLSIEP